MDFIIFVLALSALIVMFLCYKAGQRDGYWNGRGSGWRDCEKMILDRAEEHPNYKQEDIWRDLVR